MNNSVFVSYRRSTSAYFARAVYEYLRTHGVDAFLDVEGIDEGHFDTTIRNEIARRPYLVIILSPGCLDRCIDPEDWLRREIEYAMDLGRTIIPLTSQTFDWGEAKQFLTGKLAELSRNNAINVPYDFFKEAMERLCKRFLKVDILTPETIEFDEEVVRRKQEIADKESEGASEYLDAQRLLERAIEHMNEGDLTSAIVDLDQALHLDIQFTQAFLLRAQARYKLEDVNGAIDDWTSVLNLNPNNVQAFFNRGLARHKLGQTECVKHLRQLATGNY